MGELRIWSTLYNEEAKPWTVLGDDGCMTRYAAEAGGRAVAIRVENLRIRNGEPCWVIDPEAGVDLPGDATQALRQLLNKRAEPVTNTGTEEGAK